MKHIFAKLCPVAAIVLATAAAAVAVEPNFTNMENGDRVEITMKSTGCFHNFTRYFDVRKRDGVSVFTEYGIVWSKTRPGEMDEKTTVGYVFLTPGDLEGLNGLIKFYKGKKDAGSTTETWLLLEYFEQGRRIKVENLYDPSGGYGLEKRQDVVDLWVLGGRCQAQK